MKKTEDPKKLKTRRKLLGWGEQVATSMVVLDDQLGGVTGGSGPKIPKGQGD